ncbi:DUF4250 domain-containing protein [Vibrio sp. SS-MA-C1-2]|uniref:DUF4250 domain-containing protein n=1 Tax=Vibrio sp. SS-MA-C1-2 TaxID=2908646 RepID=UPI001F23B0C1|nr:DUF4250 domain-containing protein [Vibrio sp. SS-MA-C1-2]UJF17029.1 DUF4250 domain-containing protein [Vibrio sp. SS-MA-C1-2]
MNLDNFQNMDPATLLGIVNGELRNDFQGDLDDLVSFYGINKSELKDKLKNGGFDYLDDVKQFR